MNYSKYNLHCKFLIVALVCLVSCKKYVTVGLPYTQFASENIFSSNDGVIAAINGVYNVFATPDGFATDQYASVTLMGGLLSDELNGNAYPNGSDPYAFFINSLLPNNFTVGEQLWRKPYKIIYMCNSIIEGLDKSQNVTDSVKKQVEGEAKFMRAFLNFYLVNMYGNIPLVTSTDWKINTALPQSSPQQVYDKIIQDLEEAKALISENYLRSGERLYVNKAVVRAFLSKVYLYVKNWQKAEEEATAVIDGGPYHLEQSLDAVFLPASSETLWQIKPIEEMGKNTREGATFILISDPYYAPFLSDELLGSFEANDLRRANWVSSYSNGTDTWYYAFKYKLNDLAPETLEYSVVLRLSELYLIRAEARAQLNNIQGNNSAASDLNLLRFRAELNDVTAITQAEMLDAVYHERQIELFTEWGNRWFDLKRWGLSGDVLSGIKNGNWQITDTIFPIPELEINNNPIAIQNPGYQ